MLTVIFCIGFVLVFIVIKLLEWAEGLSEYFFLYSYFSLVLILGKRKLRSVDFSMT